jgi:beta-phosphoglucomutase-like phosphatase (HAD superfamily)
MRAVAFDCDGVLVDSEPHSWTAWKHVTARRGFVLADEQIATCTGFGYRDTHAFVSSLGDGFLPPPEDLLGELLEALAASFATGLRRFDDAVGAVADLAFEGVPLAVASSSPRARLDLTLEAADLTRYFDVSVAGDEVARPKPAPDVYVEAAERLGTAPRDCLAVEDSEPGARAAVAAGMRVIAVARDPEAAGPLVAAGAGVVASIDAESIKLLIGL